MNKNKLLFFYMLSFLEGGMMLVTELASSRSIAVFFGSSLYVWLIVLCITMIGLALGYYWANNYLHKKIKSTDKLLSTIFLILSVALMLWKFNSDISLWLISINMGLIPSVIADALFLLLIPMFVYGAVTTLIIGIAQNISDKPVYGKILAYSTVGSVLFAVISVMFAFPYVGIQSTIIGLSIVSLLLSVIVYSVNWWLVSVLILLLIYPSKKIRKNILYQNDGAFSSVMVIDENNTRYLLVNYIIQSFEDYANQKTLPYAVIIDSVLQSQRFVNKDVLILGLGGGIIANKLSKYNTNITGVEIDPRIIACAKKYFSLNNKVKDVCEDAQWFIQQTKNKYDIIIMDMFNGEEPPSYLLTKENFERLKKILNKEHLLVINWYGYYTGDIGKGTRVLINTLNNSGFYTSCILSGHDEKSSNLIVFASLNNTILPNSNIHLLKENAVNTADKNILSYLNAEANYHWRKDYLHFIKHWWK